MTQNILSYALSNDCKVGFSSGTFPGNSYTEELPDEGIKYGTWEITKRTQNTVTVKLFSPYKSTMWINSYVNTAGWNGWKQMVVNTDLITKSLGSENLNNIKGSGWHCQTHTANATTERNYPIEEAGFLLVTPIIDSSFILQQYTASITNATYKRVYQQGVWRNWQQL